MSVNRRCFAAACALLAGCGVGDAPSAPEGKSTAPVEVPAPQLDDATYLYRLGLMRGHLFVGNALFEHGETMAAGTHSKHPTDELYAPMATEFAARGSAGFAAQLDAHAAAVAAGDEDEVAQRYTELLAAIADNEAVVDVSPRLAAEVIVRLVAEAAEEYAIGIVDGKPANAHEYQDAYGFTQVAIQWASQAGASDSDAKPVFDRVAAHLAELHEMWPALMPPPEVPYAASMLHRAAASIEVLASGLDP